MINSDFPIWSDLIRKARLRLLKLHHQAKVGHIGGNLSCLDTLVVLHHAILQKDDFFLLSKGHSAGALYIALWSCGVLEEDVLKTFALDGTYLGIHTPTNHPEVAVFGTGSLGHGPSLAAGIVLGRRIQRKPGRVFCLCSDGEWQEGSCWEALSFAVHQGLDELLLIVDVNGWQGFGSTYEVASMNMDRLRVRFEAFGANVLHCDGHNHESIMESLKIAFTRAKGRPSVLLLQTCKGKGLTFLEDKLSSHYLPLTDEEYFRACRDFEG